jgi:hypothetical protein
MWRPEGDNAPEPKHTAQQLPPVCAGRKRSHERIEAPVIHDVLLPR